MQRIMLTSLLLAGLYTCGCAQDLSTAPVIDIFEKRMAMRDKEDPDFRRKVAQMNNEIQQKAKLLNTGKASAKTTAVREIPVIFHVVLNTAQIAQLGGQAGIEERIKSQMEVLNEDFNAMNADSVEIPGAFKPLYGNMNFRFSLARKDPGGNPISGYEIITTTKSSFDALTGTMGSTLDCSDAKFTASGGVDAWDTKKYLNVWVVSISPAGVAGIGTPPPYPAYGGTASYPWNEQRIALGYHPLGKRTKISPYFPSPPSRNGRTLVHEVGHFFNLFHPFGIYTLNNSSCTDDDGVTDTPPQALPTQSICPTFPVTDTCSPNSPGIMFMNHMDYTADSCRLMFTIEQAARANVELDTGGYRYSLLDNAGLIWPYSINDISRDETVLFPNPANSSCIIRFAGQIPKQVLLLNSLGQTMAAYEPTGSKLAMKLDGIAKGIYIVRSIYTNGNASQRLSIY